MEMYKIFAELEHAIFTGSLDIDLRDFQERAELADDWTWQDVEEKFSVRDVEWMIHAGTN